MCLAKSERGPHDLAADQAALVEYGHAGAAQACKGRGLVREQAVQSVDKMIDLLRPTINTSC